MRQLLITGASSDIGIAICKMYLSQGYRVVGHFHKGQDAFSDLVDQSADLTSLKIDLSLPDNLEKAIREKPELFASSDVLINAAAILEPAPFHDITAETVLRSLTINLIPGLLLMRTMAPAMAERGWGRIVHLGSIGAKFGGGSSSFCYALSKRAMEFIPADHKAWAARNVLVNTIRVGVTDTRFHKKDPGKDMAQRISLIPAGRMASPDEMAKIVYWLGSEENTFITGQTITAAGGE